jgi:hypothetical protein
MTIRATLKDVKIGLLMTNNEPRTAPANKTVEIVEVYDGHNGGDCFVIYKTAIGRRVKVNLTRIFIDGKPRHQGFNIVKPADPAW